MLHYNEDSERGKESPWKRCAFCGAFFWPEFEGFHKSVCGDDWFCWDCLRQNDGSLQTECPFEDKEDDNDLEG